MKGGLKRDSIHEKNMTWRQHQQCLDSRDLLNREEFQVSFEISRIQSEVWKYSIYHIIFSRLH